MDEQIQARDGPDSITVEIILRETMTPRQRLVRYLATGLANDLERGTESEQWTAALLHIVVDAVAGGYEAELVRVVREWRAGLEAEG